MVAIGPQCATCEKALGKRPHSPCRQCSRPVHEECSAGGWCCPCLSDEPTREKAHALAESLLNGDADDPELLTPGRVLAASMLVGADEGAVRALLGDEQDPLIGVVGERYRENRIWHDGKVCVDDLGELENDGNACAVMHILMVLCGAGEVVRVFEKGLPTILA